ncbi:MAG: TetR/AcrR family transcriptional regulator [Lewinellaceae bacterium]|nr:TetR/AcrR family transcriptional regulator [Lewinellaceae bacterium]
MPSNLTRRNILDAARLLFNRDGIVNVRLQQIADEANVSLGNMTYHYRTKEAVVEAIWAELAVRQRELLAEFRVMPLFADIDRHIQQSFVLQQEFIFFYLDTLEVLRAYPTIQQQHQLHLQWQLQQVAMMIQFNASRGAFRPEEFTGQFSEVAYQYLFTSDQWLYRRTIMGLGIEHFETFRSSLWNLLRPFFTVMGIKEFEQLPSTSQA